MSNQPNKLPSCENEELTSVMPGRTDSAGTYPGAFHSQNFRHHVQSGPREVSRHCADLDQRGVSLVTEKLAAGGTMVASAEELMQPSSRPPRTPSRFSDSVRHQLNMYALAASAAGVGVLALAKPAEAKVVYTPAHQQIVLNHPLLLDVNHDGKTDFTLSWMNFAACAGYNGSCPGSLLQVLERFHDRFYGPPQGVVASSKGTWPGWPAALRAGVRVGTPGQRFGASSEMAAVAARSCYSRCRSHYEFGPWETPAVEKDRYLGFKFLMSGKYHYGWARIAFDHPVDAILTGYAYETIANKPIVTGKTKGPDVITVQPATLGHLAGGTSAISRWRVNQTAAAPQ